VINLSQNILINVPSLQDPGGVASFYNSILPRLSNENYAVATLQIGSTNSRFNLLHPIADQLCFHQAITKNCVALVHINPSLNFRSFFRDGLFAYQSKLKGLPLLVFFHGWLKDFEQVVSKKLLWFFRSTYGKADGFIVLATEFKKVLEQWGITQPIYLGTTCVEDSLLADFSISEKLTQTKQANKIKILFLARLEKEKGIFETVDAVSVLIRKGLPVSLSIAGDGDIMGELWQHIIDKRLPEESVRFLDYLRNKEKIAAFSSHHIYCLPTYGEGLPASVLEAMAFGMPIVTRPVGGIRDFFINGKMGYTTDSKKPEDVAYFLERIISDKDRMIEMAIYNHKYAIDNFMASKVAEKIRTIYIEMLRVNSKAF
jgi:glycosyltransferase involved in cell wall biosynthesis